MGKCTIFFLNSANLSHERYNLSQIPEVIFVARRLQYTSIFTELLSK